MKITITTGVGQGPTTVAAFDAALNDAGVANYNLIALSSIIPPNAQIVRARYRTPEDEYGHRLYVVMARGDASAPGQEAWAGIGWTQEPGDGRGLFVELHDSRPERVSAALDQSLTSMMSSRGRRYGAIETALSGVKYESQPACALVIAVYESQGWTRL